MSSVQPSKRWQIMALVVVVLGLIGWAVLGRDDSEASGDGSATSTAAAAGPSRSPRREIEAVDSTLALLRSDRAVISGTVRDAGGQPIAGARVCAWPDKGELRGADEGLPRCSESGADGHYRIDQLWPVETSVSASAREFQPGRWSEQRDGRRRDSLHLSAGAERRGIDVVLEPGGVPVRGVVKDISGGVIEGALVSGSGGWWFGEGGRAVAQTDGEGRFELWAAPGQINLMAIAEGYATAETRAAAPTGRAELFLTPESTITGVVVHAQTRAPVAGATVRARASGFFSRGSGVALTDEAGRFRIVKLEPGIYDLRGETDTLYGEAATQIHLGLAQSAEAELRVHPAVTVRGRVVIAETGEPCKLADVHLAGDAYDHYGETDPEGNVLIRAVLPDNYTVSVDCEGHVPDAEYPPVVVADQPIEGLEWPVHAGRAIRGIVVDASGAEIEGVSVNAKPKAGPDDDPRAQRTSRWGADTQADGSFELSGLLPGRYALDCYGEGYPTLAEPVEVELEPTGDLDGVRLTLPGTGTLRGIVRDETGAAVPGVDVEARLLGAFASERVKTGDDGRFELPRLRAGTHQVMAQQGWNNPIRAAGTGDDDVQGETVEIVEGGVAELELVVERRTGVIRGRVVDADGGPVGDAFVDAVRQSDSAAGSAYSRYGLRWGFDRQPVLSDQDGRFELRELADGKYLVRAYREGGGEAVAEGVAVGGEVELTIVETGRIAGVVRFADGRTPDRFKIQAYERSVALTREDSFFRTDGRFELRELPPGKFQVTVTTVGGSAKLDVELGPGESRDDLDVELAALITIKGRLIDADTRAGIPGYRASVHARGGTVWFADDDQPGDRREVSDADGRFEVEDVPTGKVQMWFTPREFSEEGEYGWARKVAILPTEPAVQDVGEIELHATRIGEGESAGDPGFKTKQLGPEVEAEDWYFEVAVIRPNGPAADSGLAVGDRIVEVDGRAVSGVDSYRYQQLLAAPAGTQIGLTIEGGKQVSITLGPPLEW